MQSNSYIPRFYVIKTERTDKYSLFNYRTDHPILTSVTAESIQRFLRDNEPANPFLISNTNTYNVTPLQDKSEYLKTYTLYFNGYQNPYQNLTRDLPTSYYLGVDYGKELSDTYSYIVTDNDTVTSMDASGDCSDSDLDSDSYGDSNHLPYITGRLGHPGD